MYNHLSVPQCLCHRRHQHKVSVSPHIPSQTLSHGQYFRTITVAPVCRAPTMAQVSSPVLGTEKGSRQRDREANRGGGLEAGRQTGVGQANPWSQMGTWARKCEPGPAPREGPRVQPQNGSQVGLSDEGPLPTDLGSSPGFAAWLWDSRQIASAPPYVPVPPALTDARGPCSSPTSQATPAVGRVLAPLPHTAPQVPDQHGDPHSRLHGRPRASAFPHRNEA